MRREETREQAAMGRQRQRCRGCCLFEKNPLVCESGQGWRLHTREGVWRQVVGACRIQRDDEDVPDRRWPIHEARTNQEDQHRYDCDCGPTDRRSRDSSQELTRDRSHEIFLSANAWRPLHDAFTRGDVVMGVATIATTPSRLPEMFVDDCVAVT